MDTSNGPRIERREGNAKVTEILVERGKDHPAGPGVTVITTVESDKIKKK